MQRYEDAVVDILLDNLPRVARGEAELHPNERRVGAYERAANGRFSSRFWGFIRNWPCGLAISAM